MPLASTYLMRHTTPRLPSYLMTPLFLISAPYPKWLLTRWRIAVGYNVVGTREAQTASEQVKCAFLARTRHYSAPWPRDLYWQSTATTWRTAPTTRFRAPSRAGTAS